MSWLLIHTKPRQERIALLNLEQQGYECYLPTLPTEKIQQDKIVIAEEPLFPRYLFVNFDPSNNSKSWGPIRSTKGVNKLVSFGLNPATVDPCLINALKLRENSVLTHHLFSPGERLTIDAGAFTGIDAIYQSPEGEDRAMILIELLSKPVSMSIKTTFLRKIG